MGVSIPLVWLAKEGVPVKCRWDEYYVEDLVKGAQKRSPWMPEIFEAYEIHPGFTSAIVSFPGGAHEPEDVHWLNEQLMKLERVILFITSNEAQTFKLGPITHPQCEFWIQLPRPEIEYPANSTFITEGSGRAWQTASPDFTKDLQWFYAGQVNHKRRRAAMDAMNRVRVRPNVFSETDGFLQGVPREDYLDAMARAKLAPAPAGVASQSSFRCQEALEYGAVPIVDALRDDLGGQGFWDMVYLGVPIPRIEYWSNLGNMLAEHADRWAFEVIDVHSAYHRHRRGLANRLAEQARWLQGTKADPITNNFTVVMPTSPIREHPSLTYIDETIRSIRERTDAEILVMCDGIRQEQKALANQYDEYLRKVNLAAENWFNVTPIVFSEHLHQAEMLNRTLPEIDTEHLMFVEHDTPLVNDIPFDDVIDVMRAHALNSMRFHHESHILPDHSWLMVGDKPKDDGWWPTMQWSQRPHLARTDWYRGLMEEYFHPTARTMIEDVMYGVLANARKYTPDRIWGYWRTAIYHPLEGTIQRSIHTDGRQEEPKWDNRYRYGRGGKAPKGAPNEDVGL
jgi:hypothetical protein